MNRLIKMLNDIDKYKDYNFEKDVEERLLKVNTRYFEELEAAQERVLCKKLSIAFKELNRNG